MPVGESSSTFRELLAHPRAGFLSKAFLFAIALVVLFWIPAYANMPMGRDQGIHFWVADTILRGGVSYLNAWDVKGPMAHYTVALGIFLFGHTDMSVRLLDLLFLAGACVAYVWLLRPFIGFAAAAAAGPIVLVLSRGHYWILAQPDVWASIAVLGATALTVRPGRYLRAAYLGIGFLIAYATFIKPFYIVFGIPLLVYLWSRYRWEAKPKVGLIAAGFALPALALLLVFVRAGGLGAFWEIQWQFDLFTYARLDHNSFSALIWRSLLAYIHPLAVGLATLVGITYLWRRSERVAALLVAQYVIGWVVFIAQGKFFPYHEVTFGVFSAALAVCMFAPVSRFPRGLFRMIMLPALMLAMLAQSYLLTIPAFNWWTWVTGNQTYTEYMRYFESNDFSALDLYEASAWIKAHTEPGDSVFQWGFDPGMYFLSERYPATRLAINTPLVVSGDPYRAQVYAELLASLRTKPPRMFVVEDKDGNNIMSKTSTEYLEQDFPELRDWAMQNYTLVYSNDRFKVYEKK